MVKEGKELNLYTLAQLVADMSLDLEAESSRSTLDPEPTLKNK